MYIKICGIKSLVIAEAAVKAGAHFIGLIFDPKSRRAIDLATACAIAHKVRAMGAEPVAVFTDADATHMKEICNQAAIQYVQLHGKNAREQHVLLPEVWHRIYVCPVAKNGVIVIDDPKSIKQLKPTRDFLLFDGMQAGSGTTFSWDNFKIPQQFPPFSWFLSGGLRKKNVCQGIKQLTPDGVDVSSGVEDETGEKAINLIQEFINLINPLSPPPEQSEGRCERVG
jgi:phosphoribosylanthranilate isomerase